jgi:membrane protein YqaA with SNARE-associated domain
VTDTPRSVREAHPLLRVVALPAWDSLLWASGAVAGLGIVLESFVPPASELAVLFSLALLANGPFSMFLPATVEPMVMVFARLYPWMVVAGVVTVAAVLAEYADYRIFTGILMSGRLEQARRSRTARFVVWMFEKSPFLAVVMGALTPLPFWLVRISAVLSGYPVSRFLVATAVGRFPRFLAYAAIAGVLPVSTAQLGFAGLGLTVVFAVAIGLRGRRPRAVTPDLAGRTPSQHHRQ